LRFRKLIPIEEEIADSEFDFQDTQSNIAFDNDDEVIARGSLSFYQFNYQEEIQHRETLESDNLLIKEILLVINVKDLR